jgi:hypothetical protein
MLENRKIRIDRKRKEMLDAITRKTKRELGYEMNPYEWNLVKLPNGKTRSVRIKEKRNL